MTRSTLLAGAAAAGAVCTALGCVHATRAAGTAPAPKPALLILGKADNSLAILDPTTYAVLGRVPVGEDPHEVVVSPDGRLAYVANYGKQQPGNTLSVVDIAARKELRRIDLGPLRRPHGLMEHGGKIYFTAEVNRAVARFDPQSGLVDWVSGTGQNGSHMLALSPDGERVYTTDIASDTVTVIDRTVTNGPGGIVKIQVGKGPEGIAVSPDGREVWIGHRGGGAQIISTASNRVTATIPEAGPMLRLQFTPDGKRVLGTDIKGGEVVVYDAATRKEARRIPVGQGPAALLVTPDGKLAFVGVIVANEVAVIDLDKLVVTGTVKGFGSNPDGIAWAAPKAAPAVAVKRRGVLGIAVGDVPEPVRQANGLAGKGGIFVPEVFPGSPAHSAGVRTGDVILTVDGKEITSPAVFQEALAAYGAGDTLTLGMSRGGDKVTVQVKLAPRPVQ